MIVGAIERFLTEHHAHLDGMLAAAEQSDGTIDLARYAAFRGELLRHIAMEEKVLLRWAHGKRGEALAVAVALHVDHGAIAKLLVRTPNPAIVAELRELLGRHNGLEEGPTGLYATCDALAEGDDGVEIVRRLRDQPPVPLAPYYDGPPHRR